MLSLPSECCIFFTGPLETTHIGTLMLASNSFAPAHDLKFGIKQTSYFCAVNVLGIGSDHRHALFFTDDVDDFVEFYAFKTGKNLFQLNVNAKFPAHRDIGARANDLAIDQRTVAVEKYRFYLDMSFLYR